MNISKLNYKDKKTAIADLLVKKVYNKDLTYAKGIQAVVEIGKIVLENATYDAEFNEITAPIYAEGYAYDVMSEIEYTFESQIFPNNPKHNFAGCEIIKEIELNNLINEQRAI